MDSRPRGNDGACTDEIPDLILKRREAPPAKDRDKHQSSHLNAKGA